MESTTSKAVKFVLRILRFNAPFRHYQIDIGKVRKYNVDSPNQKMCKACEISSKEVTRHKVWYLTPKNISNKKVILYFHGGAYISGMVKEQWKFIANIAVQSGSKVVIPEYPLAPEYNYKDVFSLLLETYDQLLKTTNSDDITFLGDSAGGGLLLSFAMLLRNDKKQLPFQLVALSPWVDLSMTNPEMEKIKMLDPLIAIPGLKRAGELYANEMETTNFLISPLYGDISGLPSVYLFAGTHDILYPDQKLFSEKAKAAGVETYYHEYPEMIHCWMLLPLPEAKGVLRRIAKILARD